VVMQTTFLGVRSVSYKEMEEQLCLTRTRHWCWLCYFSIAVSCIFFSSVNFFNTLSFVRRQTKFISKYLSCNVKFFSWYLRDFNAPIKNYWVLKLVKQLSRIVRYWEVLMTHHIFLRRMLPNILFKFLIIFG